MVKVIAPEISNDFSALKTFLPRDLARFGPRSFGVRAAARMA